MTTIPEGIPKNLSAEQYKSEIRKFPHARSIEGIENLAMYRGIQSGLKKQKHFN